MLCILKEVIIVVKQLKMQKVKKFDSKVQSSVLLAFFVVPLSQHFNQEMDFVKNVQVLPAVLIYYNSIYI